MFTTPLFLIFENAGAEHGCKLPYTIVRRNTKTH
jgi:hypothetical protein